MKSNILEVEQEIPFLDSYLLYILAQASDTVSGAFHTQLADLGVSIPKWRIMASLYPDKTLNVGELARKCLMKQPTLTRQVDRLCVEGITTRVHEKADRRGVLVSLTAMGRQRAKRYVDMAKDHEMKLLEDISADEVAKLKSALRRLAGEATPQDMSQT